MRRDARRAVDITVTGRVQGVSFRAYAEQEAARLGVVGWVRNEPDGDVAAHVEGDPEAVDAFVRWCHDGPPLARVSAVEVVPAADTGATSFDVRF
jgi:acylphosphatase